MKVGWLAFGLAVPVAVGLAVALSRERRQSAPALATEPKSEPVSSRLSPADVVQAVAGYLEALTVSKPPAPDVVASIAVFAAELDRQGYTDAAAQLRAAVAAYSANAPVPEPGGTGEVLVPTEPTEPASLDANQYLLGWPTTPDNIQMIVREALGHLAADEAGIVSHRPSDWDANQTGGNAKQLETLGQIALANNLLRLLEDAAKLPEAPG